MTDDLKPQTQTAGPIIADLPAHLRQIADELDDSAVSPPCSEAEIVRLAASKIERLMRWQGFVNGHVFGTAMALLVWRLAS